MGIRVTIRKKPDLAKPRKAMATATRAVAREAGRIARTAIRQQIPHGAGPVGKWPGYAATGALQNAVVAQEPLRLHHGWEVRVGVQHTRHAAVYARIHELGGVIRPRRAKALRFEINGKIIFAQRVRIRRKRWFLTGWRQAQEQIRARWKDIFIQEVRIR